MTSRDSWFNFYLATKLEGAFKKKNKPKNLPFKEKQKDRTNLPHYPTLQPWNREKTAYSSNFPYPFK